MYHPHQSSPSSPDYDVSPSPSLLSSETQPASQTFPSPPLPSQPVMTVLSSVRVPHLQSPSPSAPPESKQVSSNVQAAVQEGKSASSRGSTCPLKYKIVAPRGGRPRLPYSQVERKKYVRFGLKQRQFLLREFANDPRPTAASAPRLCESLSALAVGANPPTPEQVLAWFKNQRFRERKRSGKVVKSSRPKLACEINFI